MVGSTNIFSYFDVIDKVMRKIHNIFNSLSQTSVTTLLSKFVAFKILIQMQDYYSRSRANFNIRNAVAKNPLVIITDIDRVVGLCEED